MSWLVVAKRDRWPEQVRRAFGFLFDRDFRVIDHSTYRLGETTTLAKGDVGLMLDSDGDSGTITVALVRLRDGALPEAWWESRDPRIRLDLEQVAGALAPALLDGRAALPRIRREADRAAHLEYWATVLRAVAQPWLDGDTEWFDRTERQIP